MYCGFVVDHTQNCRMVGVGRDLWRSSSPTPLPKLVHLEQAAQDLIQAGFEYLQRRRLHSPPGQPVPVLCHPQSKEVLPHVQMELSVLQFVPVAPCLVTGHYWRESGPILLTIILKIFIRSPLSLLFFRQTLFFNILNSLSSGSVLTRRTSGILGEMLASPEEHRLASWNPAPPSPFRNRVRAWTVQYGSWGIQTGGRPFLFPSKLLDVPCGLAWAFLGKSCWCKGERRMYLLGGREREGWRGGRISIQASQRGYKEFINSERSVFSLYHLLLGLWCNEIAFSQVTIEGS